MTRFEGVLKVDVVVLLVAHDGNATLGKHGIARLYVSFGNKDNLATSWQLERGIQTADAAAHDHDVTLELFHVRPL